MSSSQDSAPQWQGVPEVVASGSAYEIGFQHGSQIPRRIQICIENYKILFADLAQADWEESKRRAATYLPSLEEKEPDLVEEMRGVADGAASQGVFDVDFHDILALNLRSEISLTNYSDGCTSLVTSHAETGTIVSENWDWVAEASNSTAFFDIRKTGKPRIRMFGEAGIIAKFGLNDAGVGICMNAIRCGTVAKDHLPVHLAMRRVLECASFDEALALLQKKGLASCCNFAIGDASGKLATVECTPKGIAPIYPDPGQWTTFHTNHLWSPNVPAGIKDHPSPNSFSRLERIRELSRDQKITPKMAREWYRDEQGTPTSICRSSPPGAKGIERMETLATIIIEPEKRRFELSLGRPSLNPPVRLVSLDE